MLLLRRKGQSIRKFALSIERRNLSLETRNSELGTYSVSPFPRLFGSLFFMILPRLTIALERNCGHQSRRYLW